METITDLIKGVSVPRMVKIREVFDDTHIPVNMIADMVNAELSREALGGQVKSLNKHRNYVWRPGG